MFLQLIQHSLNSFHVLFPLTLSINENVIEVHNNKDIKFLYQDLIDIALK